MKKTLFALTLAASLGLAACSNPGDEVVVSTQVLVTSLRKNFIMK